MRSLQPEILLCKGGECRGTKKPASERSPGEDLRMRSLQPEILPCKGVECRGTKIGDVYGEEE